MCFSPLPVVRLKWLQSRGSDGLSLPLARGHLSCQTANGSRSRDPGMEPKPGNQDTDKNEGHNSNGVGQKSLSK